MKFLMAVFCCCLAGCAAGERASSVAGRVYDAYNQTPRDLRLGADQERGAYVEMVYHLGPQGKTVSPAR